MKILLLSLVCLIVFIYIKHYNEFKTDEMIIYNSYYNLTTDDFNKKYPVLMDEGVENQNMVIEKFFKGSYYKINKVDTCCDIIQKNLSKYALIHNNQDHNINIKIISPGYNEYNFIKSSVGSYNFLIGKDNKERVDNLEYIEVEIGPKQLLMVPTFWGFSTKDGVSVYYLQDFISILISHWHLYKSN